MTDVIISLPIALFLELWLGKTKSNDKSFIDSSLSDGKWHNVIIHPISLLGKWLSGLEKVFLDVILNHVESSSFKNIYIFISSIIAFVLALTPAVIISILWIYGHNYFWLDFNTENLGFIKNMNQLLEVKNFNFEINIFYILAIIKTIWVIITALIMFPFFATRLLYERCLNIRKLLNSNKIKESRKQLVHLVGRNTSKLGKIKIIRAVIESVSENFVDAALAPIMATVIAGPVGLFIYKSVSTLDSMWGYTSSRYKIFGYLSAKTDDVFNYIPARISVLIIILVAKIIKLSTSYKLKDIIMGARQHKSPNSGWPESAYSHVLGIKLRGLIVYGKTGKTSSNYYIGNGRLIAKLSDLDNALKVYRYSILLILILLLINQMNYIIDFNLK